MYNLPYFKSADEQRILEFMQQHPFVTLNGVDDAGRPVATHVPVMLEKRQDQLFLVGHIMKQTDHHKAFLNNNHVLAIFSGPHSYISASWYTNPKQASTWNYMIVHARGFLRYLPDDALYEVLRQTTAHFENNESSPARVEELPDEYVHRLMKAIVAFEIEVTELDHLFKLSQNRDEESYRNIINKLLKGDCNAAAVAHYMMEEKTSTS